MADGFEFDDHGAFAAIGGALVATGVRAGAQAYGLVRTYGVRLQSRVKAYAAGRPGPRVQTGDYNRSIGLTVRAGSGTVVATAGTNKAQGRRLEHGFDGEDSLGRSYHQPAYKHFGPAKDEVGPEFVAAAAVLGTDMVDDAISTATAANRSTPRLRDDRGRFV